MQQARLGHLAVNSHRPFSKSFVKRSCHLLVLGSCCLLLRALELAVLLITFETGRKPMSIGFRLRSSACRIQVCRHNLLLSPALEADY
jgi:hypothetical protein